MKLMYKSIQEKIELLNLNSEEYISMGEDLISKTIFITDSPQYILKGALLYTVLMKLPLNLKEDEYFIYHKLENMNYIRGNILEHKYLNEFFPEDYKVINRNKVIDDIIGME